MGNSVMRELQKFRKLSSDRDYELILSDELSFYEYKRLAFILESLKLTALESELIVRHMDRFCEEREYLNERNKSSEIYVDWERYNKWLEDFLNNIKDKNDRKIIGEMFSI